MTDLDDRPRYRPSGRVDPGKLLRSLALLAAASAAIAAGYYALLRGGVYLAVVSVVIPTAAAAGVTRAVVKHAHCRHRALAGALGITVGQVAMSLRPAFAGLDAGDWIDPGGETRKVMIRLSPEARTNVTDLRQLPLVVTGQDGRTSTIPLSQVATLSPVWEPSGVTFTVCAHADPQARASDNAQAE